MGIESPKIVYLNRVKMDFHEHLRHLRETRELTQAQVAEAVGIAKNTYVGYEKGPREPKLGELKKLATLFDVELGELCLEAQNAGLSGWLKATLKRADRLRAREKAALLEVVSGYIKACEIAQISSTDDQLWAQQMQEEEMDELVRLESGVERSSV